MKENSEKNKEEVKKKGKKKAQEDPLPFCTTAADPEHSRAADEDEPCDDRRAGDPQKDKKKR